MSTDGREDKIEAKAASVVEQPASDTSVSSDSELLSVDARPAAERRLVRQLDLRLMPTIIVIFIMNYIDVSLRWLFNWQYELTCHSFDSEVRSLRRACRASLRIYI